MAKLPFMSIAVDEFLASTRHLSTEDVGATTLLMMAAWRLPDCRLPDDDRLLARWANMTPARWRRAKASIMSIWQAEHGFWRNPDVTKQRKYVEERAEVSRQNGLRGGRPKSLESKAAAKPAGSPELTRRQSTYNHKQTDTYETPAPDSSAAAREIFRELWETFPRNPTSSEGQARAAYLGLAAEDRDGILEAAKSFRAWFVADCQSRKRSLEQSWRYAPHLWRWISSGDWKQVPAATPLHHFAPSTLQLSDVEYVDRFAQATLFEACERLRGRPVPQLIQHCAFPKELVRKARDKMSSSGLRPMASAGVSPRVEREPSNV
jgi:uncharacterized protein YdaU (DUF1376 family)